ncbi:MAG TPA: squalene synthase HpnC [Bacteroidota bacterium]|nr:squalene synthase HpnC [Bacteroidota bacterium]
MSFNPPSSDPLSVELSFRYCEDFTYRHDENFPVASFFIPKDKRKYIAAIYAFARTADDFADEPGVDQQERMGKLIAWEQELADCYAGTAKRAVFIALRETINQYDIPQDLFLRLLTAFKSDVTTRRHATFHDVLRYCTNSANPVGRLVLLLFGYRDEKLFAYSDHICTALQLTNFWQDVTVDLDKDRVYLPLEDLRRFGVSEQELLSRSFTPAFRNLLEFQVTRTREHFEKGKPLLESVRRDLKLELRLTWRGGMEILRKIENAGYDVLTRRPVLSKIDKLVLLFRSLLKF